MDVIQAIFRRQNNPMLVAVGHLRSGITLLPRAFRRKLNEFVKFERDL